MIVLDTSATIEYLLERTHGPWVKERLTADPDVHCPHLIDVEVTNTLRSLVLRGTLTEADALRALDEYSEFAVERYAHWPLLGRVWQLRAQMTAYDAVYVALAETIGATLVTADARLARAQGHHARIVTP